MLKAHIHVVTTRIAWGLQLQLAPLVDQDDRSLVVLIPPDADRHALSTHTQNLGYQVLPCRRQ